MDEFMNYNEENVQEQNVTEEHADRQNADAGHMEGVDGGEQYWAGMRSSPQPKHPVKKSKVPAIVVLAVGIVLAIAGLLIVFSAEHFSVKEEAEPVDVYFAKDTDEYSFALIQYMTEPVAYYESMEKVQFYIAFDMDWNPALICVHDDELETYMPYIDWLYSDSYENEPEQLMVTGYAQPIDEELAEHVVAGYNDTFGDEILNEANYTDWFGSYFLQIGQKNSAYGVSKLGIYLLGVAVLFLVGGSVLLYGRRNVTEESGPIVQENNLVLGILGAGFGALLGGLLWAVVAAIGYYYGWLGILMIVFAFCGYNLFEHKRLIFGGIISLLFSLAMVIAASYFGYAWSYYCSLNESINGYVPLWRAIKDLYPYMVTNDLVKTFGWDLAKSVVLIIVAFIYMLATSSKKKN